MNILKTTAAGIAISAASTAAFAGGLDRAGNPVSFLFEDGEYVELSFAHVRPDVTSAAVPNTVNGSYNQVTLAYKTAVTENFDLGLAYYTPIGARTRYSGGLGPAAALNGVNANLSANAIAVTGRYKIGQRVSIIGGLRHVSAKGGLGSPAAQLVMGSDGGFGFIAGAAYERPEIAMRVALTYESKIDLELPTSVSGVVPVPASTGAVPEAINLEFQTGVAANTLVFGSIRHAKWSDANVIVPAAGGPQTDYDNTTAYSLGVGRKINDKWSISLSASYEKSTDGTAGRLAPSDGRKALALGARYTVGNGVVVSGGVNYTKFGDAVSSDGIPFADNKSLAYGLKIAKSF